MFGDVAPGFAVCGIVCVSGPAAFVVIGVGGPMVVAGIAPGVVAGGVIVVGGGTTGAAVCELAAGTGGGGADRGLVCAATQVAPNRNTRRVGYLSFTKAS